MTHQPREISTQAPVCAICNDGGAVWLGIARGWDACPICAKRAEDDYRRWKDAQK